MIQIETVKGEMKDMFEKLLEKLKELFQLNQPELDFGIYRIMHAKSDEITKFLDQDLLPQVKVALSGYQSVDRARVERELDEAINQANSLGVDPDSVEKVKTLRAQLSDAPNAEAVEAEVYEALYKFFRRYYTQGDFLSRRVYKKDVYAIPYEGEEVTLHWANKDQYYIKSSETLRDYAFRLRPDDAANPMRVHFRVVGADEEEHNTVKTAEGKQRVFILAPNRTPEVVDGELHIYFQYEQSDKKQNDLTAKTADWFKASANKDLIEWKTELLRTAAIKSNESRTLLEKHLEQYTARNTFDYFIHKDLGGFLRRELDFFIKNEIMHLDDIEDATAERADQYLAKIKAVKNVSVKIITFLAELEDFQKKLWLKKKFVVSARWLIPIALIPDVYLPEIARNSSQVQDWIHNLSLDELEDSLFIPKITDSISVDDLKRLPALMIDTKHFSESFSESLIGEIDDLANLTSGELLHSENFQALHFLKRAYSNRIDAVYIDPPYNSASSEILYKNNYKHSSWLSLMNDRLQQCRALMKSGAPIAVAIDDIEVMGLKSVLISTMGSTVETVVVRSNPAGRSTTTGFSLQHEYLLFAWNGMYDTKTGKLAHSDNQASRYGERDAVGPYEWVNFRKHGGFRRESPKMYYPIVIHNKNLTWRLPVMSWNSSSETWDVEEKLGPGESISLPIDENGQERRWKWAVERFAYSADDVKIKDDRNGNPSVYIKSRIPGSGVTPPTVWDKKEYSATDWGTRVFKDQFGVAGLFDYPKAPALVEDSLRVEALADGDTVLDFFGGSGTTAVAVANLNREDGGHRRFVIVEMGEHLQTVIVPRVQKVNFAASWKSGKPRWDSGENQDLGPFRAIKVLRLESYEDALNNLELKRTAAIDGLFSTDESALREEYVLKYMLDVETRGSASLLNMSAFSDPRKYTLRVKSPGTDETVETNVDLLETFNWLLGLRVKHVAASETYSAEFSNKAKRTVAKLKSSETGSYWFRQVTGTLPDGREALIVWRTLSDDAARDEAALLAWFESNGHLASESLNVVYINGDSNLSASKPPSASWSVESLEAHFHELMFEGSES